MQQDKWGSTATIAERDSQKQEKRSKVNVSTVTNVL